MKQRIVSLFLLAAFLLLAMPMNLPVLADADPDNDIYLNNISEIISDTSLPVPPTTSEAQAI